MIAPYVTKGPGDIDPPEGRDITDEDMEMCFDRLWQGQDDTGGYLSEKCPFALEAWCREKALLPIPFLFDPWISEMVNLNKVEVAIKDLTVEDLTELFGEQELVREDVENMVPELWEDIAEYSAIDN